MGEVSEVKGEPVGDIDHSSRVTASGNATITLCGGTVHTYRGRQIAIEMHWIL